MSCSVCIVNKPIYKNRYIWGLVQGEETVRTTQEQVRASKQADDRNLEDARTEAEQSALMATEVLKIQLETLQLEYQALQVENAKLRGENPQTAQEIDTEREELTVLKNEVDELRQNLHASREVELQLSQQEEVVEEELSEAKIRIEQANKDFGGKEAAAIQEITELREANGRLLLELKCAKQQIELCEFRLSAERNKVERLQVQ